MKLVVSASLMFAAVIHLLPLSGVLGVRRLASLYGIEVGEPNLSVLMRHRAVLFGLLGLFVFHAAFNAELQPLAFVGAFVSICTFLCLAWLDGPVNAYLRRVVWIDLIAVVVLACGAAVRIWAGAGE